VEMISEIKHIILNLQLNIESLEFEGFYKKASTEKSANTFLISANGFLISNSGKKITNHIIIIN
jgi:hypothetical protein